MGASGAPTDAELDDDFERAALPAYGRDDQAHYNLFRESGDNTFFQITWSASGEGIATQIAGMPIWGGATSDTLLGRAGDDNIIHEAEGDDLIILRGWNDTIYGDAGEDTVVFSGLFSDYTLLSYSDAGSDLLLEGFGYQKHLYVVEWLAFDDVTLSTTAIPDPGSISLALTSLAFLTGLRRLRRKKQASAALSQQQTGYAPKVWRAIKGEDSTSSGNRSGQSA